MNLDEAIRHCDKFTGTDDESGAEYEDLGGWLRELRDYRREGGVLAVPSRFLDALRLAIQALERESGKHPEAGSIAEVLQEGLDSNFELEHVCTDACQHELEELVQEAEDRANHLANELSKIRKSQNEVYNQYNELLTATALLVTYAGIGAAGKVKLDAATLIDNGVRALAAKVSSHGPQET
jgi:hypothetical protein